MDLLDHLPGLASGALWRADALAPADGAVRPSGHPPLDAQLPGGGWPTGSLIELLLDAPGHGEWRLLAPALAAAASTASPDAPARTSAARANAAWGSPTPSASTSRSRAGWPLWSRRRSPPGWPSARRCNRTARRCRRWASTSRKACGSPRATTSTPPGPPSRPCARAVAPPCCAGPPRPTPRCPPPRCAGLHLAAQGRHALLFLLRPSHRVPAHAATPAPLRLHSRIDLLDPARLQLRILKRRGPPLAEALSIDTRAQLAPALAHRLSLPLPQHRPMPDTTPSTAPPATFTLDARVAALLARARLAEASLDGPSAEPHGPRP